MNNTLQLYVDDEKTIKGYPVTSPDRVIDENGKSVKDKLKNNVKFDVVGQATAPSLNLGYDDREIREEIKNINEQMDKKVFFCDSVLDMLKKNYSVGDVIITNGFTQSNDGGGSSFKIYENLVSDDVFIYKLNNGKYAKRIINDNILNVKTCGFEENKINNDLLKKIVSSFIKNSSVSTLLFPRGNYKIDDGIKLDSIDGFESKEIDFGFSFFTATGDNTTPFIYITTNATKLSFKNTNKVYCDNKNRTRTAIKIEMVQASHTKQAWKNEFSNLHFKDFGCSVHFAGDNCASENLFIHCKFADCGAMINENYQAFNNTFMNTDFEPVALTDEPVFKNYAGGGFRFIGCSIMAFSTIYEYISGKTSITSPIYQGAQITFSDCRVEFGKTNNTQHFIKEVKGTSPFIISHSIFIRGVDFYSHGCKILFYEGTTRGTDISIESLKVTDNNLIDCLIHPTAGLTGNWRGAYGSIVSNNAPINPVILTTSEYGNYDATLSPNIKIDYCNTNINSPMKEEDGFMTSNLMSYSSFTPTMSINTNKSILFGSPQNINTKLANVKYKIKGTHILKKLIVYKNPVSNAYQQFTVTLYKVKNKSAWNTSSFTKSSDAIPLCQITVPTSQSGFFEQNVNSNVSTNMVVGSGDWSDGYIFIETTGTCSGIIGLEII